MQKKRMDEIMERFSNLILMEMERKNQSCLQFSELCGVGRNIVGDIVNRKKLDVKLSTVVKICENTDINFEDIFSDRERNAEIKNRMRNAYIVINGTRFSIELKEYSTPPHAV